MIRDLELKKISDLTLQRLRKVDLITPPLFEKTYLEVAIGMGLSPAELMNVQLSRDLVDRSLSELEKVQQGTQESLFQLQTQTAKASKAIQEKDTQALESTQAEVDSLRQRLLELEKNLFEDNLTHIHNRHWLMERILEDGCFTSSGHMAFVDLNKFKQINDSYGHLTGDKVLILVSSLMKLFHRSGETLHLIRYGGDEFLVIHETSGGDTFLHRELQDLRIKLSQREVYSRGMYFHVDFAYGIAPFAPGTFFENCLEIADQAMYLDKERYTSISAQAHKASQAKT